MKLNKTERTLLDRIDKDARGTTGITHGYRTGRKNGTFGNREFNAMISLRNKGLIEVVKSENYTDCKSKYTDHWSDVVIRRKGDA